MILFILGFFAAAFIGGEDISSEENQQKRLRESEAIYAEADQIADLYRKVEGKGVCDITELLNLPAGSKRRIVLFEYPSDRLMVKGYVSFVPEASTKPLLVFLRGGNRLFGLFPPNFRWSFFKDYTVLVTTYRGGVSEGVDEYGGADVNDVKNLIDFIPELENRLATNFTSQKKYLMGGGRGGMQMFLALARFPELQRFFDKAVSLSGVLDMEVHLQTRSDLKAGYETDFGYDGQKQWVDLRNPIRYVSNIRKDFPLLLIQGTKDIRVSLEEGYNMLDALEFNECSVDYLEVEGGDTCLKNQKNAVELIAQWLEK